jgi:hypothetical protein
MNLPSRALAGRCILIVEDEPLIPWGFTAHSALLVQAPYLLQTGCELYPGRGEIGHHCARHRHGN